MPIFFTLPIRHGANRLHLEVPPLRRWTSRPPGLAIGTLNIHDGRGFGIAQAVQSDKLGGFNLMFLTETKISTTVYFRNRLGYNIFCSTDRPASAGGSQGGMNLVLQYRPTGWII